MKIADMIMYLKNRNSTSAITTTSHKLWHEVKFNLSHLRIINSIAYIHVSKKKRTKLDTHSHKEILIDYEDMNQYKIWDLTRNDVVVSRNVVFIEEKPINQTTAIYEEPRIIYDSITILPRSSEESEQQLSTSSATEHAESDSDSKEPRSDMVDPQILLQESTIMNELQESTSEST